MTTMPPIVTIDDLTQYPEAVLADVRWYLDGRSGRAAYESGHLPGAVFVDLERDLSGHRPPTDGRHPFPDPDDFAASMGALGIGDDSIVIAYDDSSGVSAGRLVVMLRMIGRNAALLDGGLQTWHGGELMTGTGAEREPLEFTPCEWPLDRLADVDEVAALAASGDGLLLDARANDRFTGEVTLIDPRPGHIPGARNAPWHATIDPTTGHFRSIADLREHFNELGVSHSDRVVAYCGSGVSACMNILALEQAGLPPARLYVASWSGWSADPDRGAELGDGR